MTAIFLELSTEAIAKLEHLARRERRGHQDQASVLLERVLEAMAFPEMAAPEPAHGGVVEGEVAKCCADSRWCPAYIIVGTEHGSCRVHGGRDTLGDILSQVLGKRVRVTVEVLDGN